MYKRTLPLMLIGMMSCGVNPARMETMEPRQEWISQGHQEIQWGSSETEVENGSSEKGILSEKREQLRRLKDFANAGDVVAYAALRRKLILAIYFEVGPELASEAGLKELIQSVYELDGTVAALGSSGASLDLSQERTTVVDKNAVLKMANALTRCSKAIDQQGEEGTKSFEAYQNLLNEARSGAADVVNYAGKDASGRSYVDVPFEMSICEARFRLSRGAEGDEPQPARDLTKKYIGCGFYPVEMEALKLDGEKFEEFLITSFYAQDADPGMAQAFSCQDIPIKSTAPSTVVAALEQGVRWYQSSDTIALVDDLKTEKRGADVYRTANVRVMRRKASLKTTRCGVKKRTVTCEAESSEVSRSYNHAAHFLHRADVHRNNGRVPQCEEMLKRADLSLRDAPPASGERSYLNRTFGANPGGTREMSADEVNNAFKEMESRVADARASGWCKK